MKKILAGMLALMLACIPVGIGQEAGEAKIINKNYSIVIIGTCTNVSLHKFNETREIHFGVNYINNFDVTCGHFTGGLMLIRNKDRESNDVMLYIINDKDIAEVKVGMFSGLVFWFKKPSYKTSFTIVIIGFHNSLVRDFWE